MSDVSIPAPMLSLASSDARPKAVEAGAPLRSYEPRTTEVAMVQNGAEWCKNGSNSLPIPPLSPPSPLSEVVDPAPRLTERQRTAVALLATGQTDAVVAVRVGVHRNTVTRWRVHNPVFATELNRRTHDVYNVLTNRVRLVAMKAARVVDQELSRTDCWGKPDAKLALNVLRSTGVMRRLEPTGSEVLAAVTDEQLRAVREPGHQNDPVTDAERDAVLRPWLADPEGPDEPRPFSDETVRREAYERFCMPERTTAE